MLAVVVDDHDMGVTHVIRGDDHLNNAFRQLAIIRAMGWPEPDYAHIPLIHGTDGAKLSKRHGALGVDAYRDELGILPEALFNYLLRLGWGHGDREEFTPRRGGRCCSISPVSARSPSRFDMKKLQNLNGHYMREADDARLAALVAARIGPAADIELLARAMPVLKTRAHDLNELADGAAFLFTKRPLEHDRAQAAGSAGRRRARALVADFSHSGRAKRLDKRGAGSQSQGDGRGAGAWPRQTGAAAARGADRADHFAGYFRRTGPARAGTKASRGSTRRRVSEQPGGSRL